MECRGRRARERAAAEIDEDAPGVAAGWRATDASSSATSESAAATSNAIADTVAEPSSLKAYITTSSALEAEADAGSESTPGELAAASTNPRRAEAKKRAARARAPAAA